jgi:choline dehydrogenase
MLDKPVISTNWLLDEADQEVAIQAYKRVREFWSHVNITTGPEARPGSNVTSDADLLEFIRGAVGPIHHATSTCEYRSRDFCSSVDGSNLLTNTTGMMGRANETMAVVDSEARVFGVSGLRVIDSSSFRFTPPGHTQAATCK